MEKSSFFNAVETNGTYDRVYKAEDFADYFNKFIGNGIFYKKSDYCQITATGNDMNISESIGSAYINGYEYSNTTALTKAITIADGVLDRIDLVVLRLDYVNREIKLYIKESAFASTPVCPSLQRDADCYELGLASIYVKHGVTAISQADITDLRLNSTYCGIVTGVIDQLDFSTGNAQFNAQMNQLINELKSTSSTFTTEFEASARDWLTHLKNELDENQAVHLQNQIDSNKTDITTIKNKIGETTLETTSQTLAGAINEVFQCGNNVKNDTVDALLQVDDSLQLTHDSLWRGDNGIISTIGNIKTGMQVKTGTVMSTRTRKSFNCIGYDSGDKNFYYVNIKDVDFIPSYVYIYYADNNTIHSCCFYNINFDFSANGEYSKTYAINGSSHYVINRLSVTIEKNNIILPIGSLGNMNINYVAIG